MKLSTLLLSSAALVVAGSAYAADLPAKKGAPAAKAATGCTAFGAGFFAIPGGDTCIKLSGYVRAQPNLTVTSDTRKHDLTGTGGMVFDARNNSDLGTVRSVLDTSFSSLDYAYLQFGGLTMGKAASATSFAPSGVAYGLHSDVTADQVTYGASAGALSFSVGLEDSVLTGSIASRPDVVAQVKTSMGALGLTAAAVSSESRASGSATGAASNGYALLGAADAKMGAVGITVYGAYAQGASRYALGTGYTTTNENTSGTLSTAQSTGLQLSAAAGPGTVYLYAGQASGTTAGGTKSNTTEYALSYKQDLAKGLYVRPEVVSGTTDGSTTNEFFLRIQRRR